MALSAALQHGFLAVLIFALIALVASFFLKDLPFTATQEVHSQDQVVQEDEELDKELVYAECD